MLKVQILNVLTKPNEPNPTFPFVWKDRNGIVWLRNRPQGEKGSRDIRLAGPSNWHNCETGTITPCVTSDDDAWLMRLPAGASITISNTY